MNDLEQAGLAGIRDCWITGGAAFDLAPSAWKELLAAALPDERERLLLAIAAQALDLGLRPSAPRGLTRRPPLPQLTLPTLPEELRPLFRAAMKQAGDGRRKARLVTLVASRGFAAHPMDWMPSTSDQDCPAVYAPWADWLAGAPEGRTVRESLSAENWDDFFPAARRVALAEMRRTDQAAARALIETRAMGEAADVRLALIDIMGAGLGHDDAPFLKSLSGDRSSKVRELANRLLARLGERHLNGANGTDQVAELAAFIAGSRAGIIHRRTVYVPVKQKSAAQERRRAELFEACNLVDLATALGVAELEFIEGWQFGTDNNVDVLLARMAASSGSDAAVKRLADTLLSGAAKSALPLLQLSARLDSGRKRAFTRKVLSGDPKYLAALNSAEAVEPGWIEKSEIIKSKALKALCSSIAGNDEGQKRTALEILETLGFIATADAAKTIADEFVAAGMAKTDPALALMRLNAALNERETEVGS